MTVWGVFDESYAPGPCPLISLHMTEDGARRAAEKFAAQPVMEACIEKLEVEE